MKNPIESIKIDILMELPVTDLGHAMVTIDRHYKFLSVLREKKKKCRQKRHRYYVKYKIESYENQKSLQNTGSDHDGDIPVAVCEECTERR